MARPIPSSTIVSIAAFFTLLATGCGIGPVSTSSSSASGLAMKGEVFGGQQPVVGSHIYLMAANTTGYGNASLSLLNAATTGQSDAIGAYVLTDSTGSFSITNDYTCTAGAQVYLYALGGNPGLAAGSTNSAAGFLATLGTCPASGTFASTVPFLNVNELTTVATAYAIAGYAVDATHVSSSGTAAATAGIANAFANAASLVDVSTGAALSQTPSGAGTVPTSTINTLGNILAACINAGTPDGSASGACSTLLSAATSDGTTSGTVATDTATAALNIAHHPGANLSALYDLQAATAPFAPSLPTQPNDFSIGLVFTGGGLASPSAIAIDDAGNAWVSSFYGPITEISNSGKFLSGNSGFTPATLKYSYGIAVDGLGHTWVSSYGGGTSNDGHIIEVSSTGTLLNDYSTSVFGPAGISVDGNNNVWTVNSASSGVSGQRNGVVQITQSGTITAFPTYNTTSGYSAQFPLYVVNDASNNVWFAGNGESAEVGELNFAGTANANAPYTTGEVTTADALPNGMAVDHSGNVWIANYYYSGAVSGSLVELAADGTLLSGNNGYTNSAQYPAAPAVDGNNTIWYFNAASTQFALSQISSTGTLLTPANGYSGNATMTNVAGSAIDSSGDIWAADFSTNQVVEYLGVAAPVITPMASAIAQNSVGVKP